jgi:hypothetical protein
MFYVSRNILSLNLWLIFGKEHKAFSLIDLRKPDNFLFPGIEDEPLDFLIDTDCEFVLPRIHQVLYPEGFEESVVRTLTLAQLIWGFGEQ